MTAGSDAKSGSDPSLTLTTLGGVGLFRSGKPLLGSGKPLALVTYLALAPGRSATREFLLDLLWADLDHDRARHALRQTMWQLRQVFGETCFRGREEVALGIPIDADRDRFVSAIEGGNPERAIALYHGQFLPAFALPGSSEFEHWADTERTRLRSMFVRAAETVARRRMASGRFREAQEMARRMREADPSNEIAWRLLLEALTAGRDLLQAAVEADALTSAFAAEGRELEPATRAVLAQLHKDRGDTAQTATGEPNALVTELVGREREFSQLLDGWAAISRGSFRHYHVSAPAGLGKTRLLTDLAHRLRTLGARLIQLRANPGDRNIGYSLAGDLGHALGALPGLTAVSPASAEALVGLSPALSTRFPNARARRAAPELLRVRTAAVAEAVSAIAFEQPVAILIDDTHWLDAESRQMLEGVLARIDKSAVIVVTAGRPSVGRPLMVSPTITLELGPLATADVHALLQALGRFPDLGVGGAIAEALYGATGGAPLLVIEALQLALERGSLALVEESWVIPSLAELLAELEGGRALASRLAHLGGEESWVLLLLATAGTPLSADELRRGLRKPDGLDEQLWSLERRGLIHRAGDGWEAAHDEIAGAAIEAAAQERRLAAHRTIGRVLGQAITKVDEGLAVCRHLAAGGATEDLRKGFRRVVQVARATGDTRSDQALAVAALDDDAGSAAARALVRSLPIRVRLRLNTPVRLAGALAAGLAVLLGVAARVGAPGSKADSALWAIVSNSTGSTHVPWLVEWDAAGWRGGEPLPRGRRGQPVYDAAFRGPVAIGVRGEWYYSAFVDNVMTDDLMVWDGQNRRTLFSAKRDDNGISLAPDGRRLVFATAQWSPIGADDYDLAILDLADSSLVRLTATDDHDRWPAWSPFNGLIAFVRRPHALRSTEVCWTLARTPRPAEHCVPVPGEEPQNIAGWADPGTVVFTSQGQTGSRLVRWNLVDDSFEPVRLDGVAGEARLSPDGRWIACFCTLPGDDVAGWAVFPVADPNASRPIAMTGTAAVVWPRAMSPDRPALSISTPASLVPVGATHTLTAVLRDANGRGMWLPPNVVRWSTGDSVVAIVEATTGAVRARRAGSVTIHALLDDVTGDSLTMTVAGDTAVTVLREDWRELDESRWVPFGESRPRLVTGATGRRGLNNGGDGSYGSGVYSRELWSPRGGLGVEFEISVPVSRGQWQSQGVTLQADRRVPVREWDHRSGSPPLADLPAVEECTFSYPGGEGLSSIERLALGVGGTGFVRPADSSWRRGEWHRVRIQIFPDGTCGFALDGQVIERPRNRISLERPYRIWMTGSSAGTDQILVGPITVWRGVRLDLDCDIAAPEIHRIRDGSRNGSWNSHKSTTGPHVRHQRWRRLRYLQRPVRGRYAGQPGRDARPKQHVQRVDGVVHWHDVRACG